MNLPGLRTLNDTHHETTFKNIDLPVNYQQYKLLLQLQGTIQDLKANTFSHNSQLAYRNECLGLFL